MKLAIIFLLLAVLTNASQLAESNGENTSQLDSSNDKINPIQDQQTPAEDKTHNKRTLFRLRPVVYRKKHIGIHPLGFRYVLGYSPLKYHYVLKRPQVTLLKPVIHQGGWKPLVPVKPVVPLKPVVSVKPVVPIKPAVPILPSGSGQNPILIPPSEVPIKPFIPAVAPTVLKPVLPQIVPQFPVFNPLLPGVPQIHPFLRPLLNQFLLNFQPGGVQPIPQPVTGPVVVPHAVPPHHTRLDIVNKVTPLPQPVLPHGNHFDAVHHGVVPHLVPQEGLVHHGNHFDAVHPGVVQHGNHFDAVQPAVVQPEGLVHHGNHLDIVRPALPFSQAVLPHGNHYDAINSVAVPHGNHYDAVNSVAVPHGNHYDAVNSVAVSHGNHYDAVNSVAVPHGNHFDVQGVVPHIVSQEGVVQHGNHLDLIRNFQSAVPHGNHLDLLPFKPLPNVLPEQNLGNLEHQQGVQDGLVPHVDVHGPQLPLYLPEHPNYKPGLSSSVQEEHSGTFPRYPLIQQ